MARQHRGQLHQLASCVVHCPARHDLTFTCGVEDVWREGGHLRRCGRGRPAYQVIEVREAERPQQPCQQGGPFAPPVLGAGGGASDWRYLSARRLALFVAASIEQGTRWVLLEHNGPATWERAQAQVETFLDALAAQGAFAGAAVDESHFVISDERVNRPQTLAEGKFNLLFGFASSKPGAFDTWLVTHRAGASRVRPVSVNRSATAKHRVEWEIETAILRG